MWATSAMGSRAIWAPSKVQPPAVAPGVGRAQPDLLFRLWAQAGSFSNAASSLVFIAMSQPGRVRSAHRCQWKNGRYAVRTLHGATELRSYEATVSPPVSYTHLDVYKRQVS